MEEFNFILIIIVLVILLSLNSRFNKFVLRSNLEKGMMQASLDQLKKEISNLVELLHTHKNAPTIKPEAVEPATPVVNEIVEEKVIDIPVDVLEQTYEDHPVDQFSAQDIVVAELNEVVEEVSQEETVLAEENMREEPVMDVSSPQPSQAKIFLQKYPDVEKFIGENLINKIGIVILILGIGFLVKFAIDNNWINEIGRVAIGVVSAGALIGVAHRMRKDFVSFSSVLIGGGLALLYFTISYAFYTEGYPLYQQQTTSFILLIAITSFAVFLSIAYNRIEIAILAILGGFTSPMMISTGSGNYIILFSYIMLLDIGMLVLSYYKKWRLVNFVAFVFTVLLFGSWLAMELVDSRYTAFSGAIFYATGFYVIFFLMNIIYNLKQKKEFKMADISLILSNTFIYFSFMMLMLAHVGEGAYKGLFAILLSAFNFGFAYYIHSKHKADANILYLLIGLVFTFVTLAVPLQLQGNYITLFWSIESVLLLWLGQKSGFKVMKKGSTIIVALMLVSLCMDWFAYYDLFDYAMYSDYSYAFLFNRVFITTLVSGGSLVATLFLVKKEDAIWLMSIKEYRGVIMSLVFLVFYLGGLFEVLYQSHQYFVLSSSQIIAVYTYNALFVLGLLVSAYKLNIGMLSKVIFPVSVVFIVSFLYGLSTYFVDNRDLYLLGEESLGTLVLLFRWLSIISVYVIGFLLYKLVFKLNDGRKDQQYKMNVSFFVFTILYLLSADLDTISVLIAKSVDVVGQTQKTGYAILWAISSFVLLVIGMKKKEQILRILGLSLFAITIAKLFIYDISNISEGGKIIAFILLGVLLLVISFMYQKLKKILTDEHNKENVETINEQE